MSGSSAKSKRDAWKRSVVKKENSKRSSDELQLPNNRPSIMGTNPKENRNTLGVPLPSSRRSPFSSAEMTSTDEGIDLYHSNELSPTTVEYKPPQIITEVYKPKRIRNQAKDSFTDLTRETKLITNCDPVRENKRNTSLLQVPVKCFLLKFENKHNLKIMEIFFLLTTLHNVFI